MVLQAFSVPLLALACAMVPGPGITNSECKLVAWLLVGSLCIRYGVLGFFILVNYSVGPSSNGAEHQRMCRV